MGSKKVICDICGALFAIENITIVEVSYTDEAVYFECPKCKHRYDICVRPKSIKLPLVSQSK